MIFKDKQYNLLIADSSVNPVKENIPLQEHINNKTSNMILSASGWRKVFASSEDEEDDKEDLCIEDKYIAGYIALSLAKHLKCFDGSKKIEHKSTTVLIGMDSRPTGPAISDVICRILLSLDINVKNLFIAAAPEIMAYSAIEKNEIDAFLYISASHNPVGHNGVKFGFDGGVYTGKTVEPLIKDFKEFSTNKKYIQIVKNLIDSTDSKRYESVLSMIPSLKKHSLVLYRQFVLETASKNQDSNIFLESLKNKLKNNSIGIIGELNGSARGYSIDKDFFNEIGIKNLMVNDKPRQIVHAIVPEGENLELCRTLLMKKHKEDSSFVVGYVPDNDGDRGNLVYIKKSTKEAVILKAQEVFALVVMAELSAIRSKDTKSKLAISVNGPTSMRIDEICKSLDVDVFRAEVGEANVVELAQQKRDEGYIVRVLGEGSNGGNITNPAKVRDPLNSIMTLISLLSDKSIFDEYRKRTNYSNDELSLENIINSLPQYTTTDAFSSDAKMIVNSNHKDLKNNYETLFTKYFESNKQKFMNFKIESYEEVQNEGIKTNIGIGENYRTPPYSGGLKIIFKDKDSNPVAFIWMRGSGTEPVFRLLVDCKDTNCYNFLLETHKSLIQQANL